MILERYGTQLDDYLAGEADAAVTREIDELLATSAEARTELDEYRRWITAVGELPRKIEPERDLWPAIERRLEVSDENEAIETPETEPASGAAWRGRLLLAASLAAALLGGVYLTVRALPVGAPPESGTPTAVTVAAGAGADDAVRTAVSQAQSDLLTATDELRLALEAHRSSLPPATTQLVEENLRVIDGAIEEIRAAIALDPGNPALNKTLVAYYQHELALLERINRAASRL